MDSPISAFAMYQKQNKNKRKNPPENITQLKAKKAKKDGNKSQKIRNTSEFSNLRKNTKNAITQKNKLQTKKVQKAVLNENEQSDEEIPILVPITDENLEEERTETLKKIKSKSSNANGAGIKVKLSSNKSKLLKNSTLNNGNSSIPAIFNPVTQGLAIFKWLIDPITPKKFFETYWEKDILYVQHSDSSYFQDIFSSERLDSILREYRLYFTRNVDVVTYENGKKEVLNPEGVAVPSQLWDYYNNGCSVRILNPQTYDQNVHSLISSLQEYFGTMVGTNVYLTPPGSQGFAPHFDDIEAFIIQLEGSKHWKLYKPKNPDVLARESSKNFTPDEIGEPFMEVTVNAGDLLYFPRGTIHEGRTQEDAHSLHITVSVYQHTAYIDLLEQVLPTALKKAASEDIEFRKGLPLNYLRHVGEVNKNSKSKKRELIINRTKALVESLVDHLDVDSAADNLGRKFMYDAMPPLLTLEEGQCSSKFDGDYMKDGKVYNRVEVSPETKVRLLRYYAVRVVKENDSTSKLFYCTDNAKTYHGEEEQWLEIDNTLIPALEMLQKKYPEFVDVESLPVEDESAKLQLISDLWERGLLVTDEPLPQSTFDSDDDSDSDSDTTPDHSDTYEVLESD